MPTKNSAYYLQEVLKAIDELEYPKEKIKLVFVDDYSTDGTYEILLKWKVMKKKQYYDIILIQEQTNIPQARNICIKHMEGEYLLFWDSDVIPPKDLLKQMINTMRLNPDIGVIGTDYSYKHKNVYMCMLGKPTTNKFTHAVYMGFALIRKDVFEKIGKFNELLDQGEDTEFCIRIVEKTSYKVMWAPKPVIHLRSRENKFFKQGFGRWLLYNFHVRGKQYAESFYKLPLLLKGRIFYYALLPLLLVFMPFVACYVNIFLALLLPIAYLLPALFLAVHGSNIRKGTISFFISNIPTGIALSYGVLLYKIRKFLKKGQ